MVTPTAATEKACNLVPINIGPLQAKVMTISKANVALEVTNPLLKEDLKAITTQE